jgi:flagellar hook-associated protein 2
MSSITFGGLASGLDTNAIIDGLVKAESIPLTAIQTHKSNVDAASQTVSDISNKLAALKTAAQALETPTGFSSYSVTSSDTAIVASVTGAAAGGSFDVQVTQLAKEQRSYSNVQSTSVSPLNMAGTLAIQVGSGTTANITIDATDSLTDIATKINQSGQRVGAAVIFDGQNYKLQVRGLDTGAANAVTMTETGFSLGLSNPPVQQAQDAKLTVDGNVITRSSNQVTGVLPGVTMALTKTTSAPVTLTVSPDATSLTTKLQALVKAYNDVVSASHFAAGYGTTKATNQELMGDSAIRGTLDQLSRATGSVVPGTSGTYTTLASIGLTKDKDGNLALDTTKLNAAVQASPTSVAALFVLDPVAGTTGAMKGLMDTVDKVSTGTGSLLQAKITALGKQSAQLQDDADAEQRHIDQFKANLQKQFTDLEVTMSQIQSNGNSLLAAIGATTTSSK